jgi:hypothetical protein
MPCYRVRKLLLNLGLKSETKLSFPVKLVIEFMSCWECVLLPNCCPIEREKVKLSVCLIIQALCRKDIWGSGGIRQHLPLYPRYPLDRRLGESHSRSGRCGEE